MQPDRETQPAIPDDISITDERGVPAPRRSWSFRTPEPVFDANGEQIGVLSLASAGDYLVVQRDGGPDLYIPLSAVNRSDISGITLSLTRADLQDERWLTPPQ
jgi:hypothetical protein